MSGSSIGSVVYIATGVPATFDKAGYDALTWVEVEDIISIGAFSTQDNMIDIPRLKDGITKGVKGARQGNDVEMAFSGLGATGQAAVRAACLDRDGEYSILVIAPNGTDAEAASGVMHSFVKNDRSDTSFEGATFMLRQNYVAVEYTNPVT